MAKKQQSKVQLVKGWLASLSPRTKLAIGGVVIFLAFVGLMIDLVIATNPQNTNNYTDAPKSKVDAKTQALRREGAIRDSAQQALQSGGGVARAETIYKNAIDSEQNVQQKVKLTIDQSEVLYDSGNYQEAIKVALDAESLSSDKFLIADWVSRLFEDQKQYDQAAHYYTLAGQWATSTTNVAKLTKSYYDSQAARVLALVGK
jgi:tetratricopeptide (TPR) repeat protein